MTYCIVLLILLAFNFANFTNIQNISASCIVIINEVLRTAAMYMPSSTVSGQGKCVSLCEFNLTLTALRNYVHTCIHACMCVTPDCTVL